MTRMMRKERNMSARAEELATRLEQVNQKVIDMI